MNDVTVDNVKLKPIIDQSNTYTSSAVQVLSKYLKPLQDEEYMLNDTLKFQELIKRLPPECLGERGVIWRRNTFY